jgi:3-oxoacyl-[acyl-carrier protein] reductase
MSGGRLRDKVAIVTGGGQGIGRGISRVFAAEGARVMIATRTERHGRATLDEITGSGGKAALCVADVGELADTQRVVAETLAAFGRIDILVHNAASFLGGAIEDYNEADLETVLAVNLKACFRLSAACIPAYYAASKGGVNAFIRTAALEVAREGITVNGIEPGYIRTAAMELLADEEGLTQMAKYIPLGYIGAPEDIAYAMLYLATDEARYVTGQTLCIDGGSTLPESPVFLEAMPGIKELSGSGGS